MDTFTQLLAATGIGILAGLVLWTLLLLVVNGVENLSDWLDHRRTARVARIEAELDAKARELRRTIYSLAEQLAAERDDVSRQMTRTAYLASGTAKPTTSAPDA